MTNDDTARPARQVALVGTYLPRQCGIATFTSDLTHALRTTDVHIECAVVAMNDPGRRHAYPSEVRFEIPANDLAAYRRAADYLNLAAIDVLSVQHEYGIFGGKAGSHVLALLSAAAMPIVTTLHTVLASPSEEQRHVMNEIARLSTRLVVMSHTGKELLRSVHDIAEEKIDLIPHGIPALPSRAASKVRLGVEGLSLLLTFGLLSPDKGIEHVIDALPAVLARHPNTRYLVVGATHPHVRESHGEAYRQSLSARAEKLGVKDSVIFHDRFVSAPELVEFLAAADIYITPYLNLEQITSGTLAYAVGGGKAVISTPYRYARELLADDRGILVPPRDSAAISEALLSLLDAPDRLKTLGERAEAYGRDMGWPTVARRYAASFERAHVERAPSRRALVGLRPGARRPVDLPELRLRHLRTLTDGTGILQHARFAVPHYQDGYCLDDNARALLLTALIEEEGTGHGPITEALATKYLAFVSHAFNEDGRRFRNFMAYTREWTEAVGSEDSQGRALFALGTVVGRSRDAGRRGLAAQLLRSALAGAAELLSVRAVAFALLGVHEYLRAFSGDTHVEDLQRQLAARLFACFLERGASDWPWCEDILAYDNARLPQALIATGDQLGDRAMLDQGLASLFWLTRVQRSAEGHFAPVGSNGFYPRGGERSPFDEQPIEACATVSACLSAWRATDDPAWVREMWTAFDWFLGENRGRTSLYDPTTGGCRDGLHAERANENQGAESTLAFLLARTEMASLDAEMHLREGNGKGRPRRDVSQADA